MPKRQVRTYDCAIIGGGPGGLVSALYLRRFKRSVVLVNSGKPRAAWGPKVRNLIGYSSGISGRLLLKRIERQIHDIGGLVRLDGEATVYRQEEEFRVELVDGRFFFARKVILATGLHDVHPQIPNLTRLRNLGLLKYCSICDGYEVSNKPVIVLAQDDFGIRKAVFIANWTKRITILVPEGFSLAPVRVPELKALGIRVIPCRTMALTPRPDGAGLDVRVNGKRPFRTTVAYVELGCHVQDSAFKNLRRLRRTREGFIVATAEMRTSVPGIFAVGDCVNLLGQISVASGQAAVAATTIHNDLI